MRTKLYNHTTGDLISDKITLAKPKQETTEVVNVLLDGSWHVQAIGDPRHSWEIGLIVPGSDMDSVNTPAAEKALIRLERHGVEHIGIISGDPEWEQLIGSTDPARAKYRCSITLLVTGEE